VTPIEYKPLIRNNTLQMDDIPDPITQLRAQIEELQRQLQENQMARNNVEDIEGNNHPRPEVQAAPQQAVNRVSVKLPPFWPDDVELWFAQVEAQFTVAQILQETTKFAYAVSQLEGRYAHEVKDIIKTPPAINPYNYLKKRTHSKTLSKC